MLEVIFLYAAIYCFVVSRKLRPPFKTIKQAQIAGTGFLVAAVIMLIVNGTQMHDFIAMLGVPLIIWSIVGCFKTIWPFKRRGEAIISAIVLVAVFAFTTNVLEGNYMADLQRQDPTAYDKLISDREAKRIAREERQKIEKEEAAKKEWEEKKCGDDSGAEVAMEHFVTQQLKAPSTAKFNDFEAQMVKCGIWEAIVPVDAENSFGAKIRTNFYVKVKQTTLDRWVPLEIKSATR